jgi:hypothetical protein
MVLAHSRLRDSEKVQCFEEIALSANYLMADLLCLDQPASVVRGNSLAESWQGVTILLVIQD